ncbi:MAG: hypothetical protein ACRDZO_03840 [Egibacteraceae bacterium]
MPTRTFILLGQESWTLVEAEAEAEAECKFEEVTGVLRADVFALLYTIVLALVIADASGNFPAAASTGISRGDRGGSAHAVRHRLSRREGGDRGDQGFGARVRPRGRRGRVAEHQNGTAKPSRGGGARRPLRRIPEREPQTAVEQAFYETSVDLGLGEVTPERMQRLLQSQESLSSLLRVLLVVGAVMFVVLGYPASVPSLFGNFSSSELPPRTKPSGEAGASPGSETPSPPTWRPPSTPLHLLPPP